MNPDYDTQPQPIAYCAMCGVDIPNVCNGVHCDDDEWLCADCAWADSVAVEE